MCQSSSHELRHRQIEASYHRLYHVVWEGGGTGAVHNDGVQADDPLQQTVPSIATALRQLCICILERLPEMRDRAQDMRQRRWPVTEATERGYAFAVLLL